jgi:hypothetical protein
MVALDHIEEAVKDMDPHESVQGVSALAGLGILSMAETDEDDEDLGLHDFDLTLDMVAFARFLSDEVPADKVEMVKKFVAEVLDRNDKKEAASPN